MSSACALDRLLLFWEMALAIQPFEICCCSLALAPVLAIVILRRHRQQIRKIEQGICVVCGYDLRGQVEPRCPECGTPFDPSNMSEPL